MCPKEEAAEVGRMVAHAENSLYHCSHSLPRPHFCSKAPCAWARWANREIGQGGPLLLAEAAIRKRREALQAFDSSLAREASSTG